MVCCMSWTFFIRKKESSDTLCTYTMTVLQNMKYVVKPASWDDPEEGKLDAAEYLLREGMSVRSYSPACEIAPVNCECASNAEGSQLTFTKTFSTIRTQRTLMAGIY